MNKQILSIATVACALAAAVLPVCAQGSGGSALSSSSMGARLAAAPLNIIGIACGAIVGTPICFARKLPQEISEGAHGIVGSITDHKSKFLLVPAGFVWLPCAGFVSLLEAPVYAWKDAYMAEKPFSKEQFSLGKLDENSK
jgi:hypothetical protein